MDKEQRTHLLFYFITFAVFLSYWICSFLIKQATSFIYSKTVHSANNETQTSTDFDLKGETAQATNNDVGLLNYCQEVKINEEKESDLKSKITMSSQQQFSPLNIHPNTKKISSVDISEDEISNEGQIATQQFSRSKQMTQQKGLQNTSEDQNQVLVQTMRENNQVPEKSMNKVENINDKNERIGKEQKQERGELREIEMDDNRNKNQGNRVDKNGEEQEKNEQILLKLIEQMDRLFEKDPTKFSHIISKYQVLEHTQNQLHVHQDQTPFHQINKQSHVSNKHNLKQGIQSQLQAHQLMIEKQKAQINELTAIKQELRNSLVAKELHCQMLSDQNNQIKITLGLLKQKQLEIESKKLQEASRQVEEEMRQKQIVSWKLMNQKLTLQLMQNSLKMEVKCKQKIGLQTKLVSKQQEIEYLYESVKQLNTIIQSQQQQIISLQLQIGSQTQNIIQSQDVSQCTHSHAEQSIPHSQLQSQTFQHQHHNKQQIDILEIQQQNQNLKNQIMFAQAQIRLFEETEVRFQQQIQNLKAQVSKLTISKDFEVLQLKQKVSRMQTVASDYEVLHRRYLELRTQLQRANIQKQKGNFISPKRFKTESQNFPQVMDTKTSHFKDSPIDNKSFASIQKSQTSFTSYSTNQPQFLPNCLFISHGERQFIRSNLHSIFEGTVKSQRIYSSKTNRNKNPHELIDNIRCILAIIKLSSGKIISAYTHESFSIIKPQSTKENIALILDVSNSKKFSNKSGLNSIIYNPNGLIWGLNQVMLKFQEPDIMYTSFGKSNSIFWDGYYSLEQLIGTDKQWAKIDVYQLYRISKI